MNLHLQLMIALPISLYQIHSTNHKRTQKGDSGSPMARKVNNQTEVIGIVSAGIRCADRKMPGVYTKVNYYLDWIRSEMARIWEGLCRDLWNAELQSPELH